MASSIKAGGVAVAKLAERLIEATMLDSLVFLPFASRRHPWSQRGRTGRSSIHVLEDRDARCDDVDLESSRQCALNEMERIQKSANGFDKFRGDLNQLIKSFQNACLWFIYRDKTVILLQNWG